MSRRRRAEEACYKRWGLGGGGAMRCDVVACSAPPSCLYRRVRGLVFARGLGQPVGFLRSPGGHENIGNLKNCDYLDFTTAVLQSVDFEIFGSNEKVMDKRMTMLRGEDGERDGEDSAC
jgi:hypothetical protein